METLFISIIYAKIHKKIKKDKPLKKDLPLFGKRYHPIIESLILPGNREPLLALLKECIDERIIILQLLSRPFQQQILAFSCRSINGLSIEYPG